MPCFVRCVLFIMSYACACILGMTSCLSWVLSVSPECILTINSPHMNNPSSDASAHVSPPSLYTPPHPSPHSVSIQYHTTCQHMQCAPRCSLPHTRMSSCFILIMSPICASVHPSDMPFSVPNLPDVFTSYRIAVEKVWHVRPVMRVVKWKPGERAHVMAYDVVLWTMLGRMSCVFLNTRHSFTRLSCRRLCHLARFPQLHTTRFHRHRHGTTHTPSTSYTRLPRW